MCVNVRKNLWIENMQLSQSLSLISIWPCCGFSTTTVYHDVTREGNSGFIFQRQENEVIYKCNNKLVFAQVAVNPNHIDKKQVNDHTSLEALVITELCISRLNLAPCHTDSKPCPLIEKHGCRTQVYLGLQSSWSQKVSFQINRMITERSGTLRQLEQRQEGKRKRPKGNMFPEHKWGGGLDSNPLCLVYIGEVFFIISY